MSDRCQRCGVFLLRQEERRVDTMRVVAGRPAVQTLHCPPCYAAYQAEQWRATR